MSIKVTSLLMGIPFTENLLYSSYPARCFNVTNQNLGALRVPKYTEKVVNVTLSITTEFIHGQMDSPKQSNKSQHRSLPTIHCPNSGGQDDSREKNFELHTE